MSAPNIKKRHTPGGRTTNMDVSTSQLKARPRTVTKEEVAEWQLDNSYILSGYRPEMQDYVEVFASLTFLHNETCNVYTHLIGALILPLVATAFMYPLSEPRFFHVTGMDYAIFGIFFCCAETCLLWSAGYHLMQDHSYEVEQFWHGLDLLGIVVVTVATFVSGIYYTFFCEPTLAKVHWLIILSSGVATAALIAKPTFRTLRWRKVRVGAYVALGASSLIPILHGIHRYGLEHMVQYSGLKLYMLELAFYGGGVLLYAFRTPERFAPGKFDTWGSSHQIFHVAIMCALYTHAIALTQAFTACHTPDFCKTQMVQRVG